MVVRSPGVSPQPVLAVLRGNSGAGKSTITREVLRRSPDPIAHVQQDYLRRIVLRESGSLSAPGVNLGLIDTVARNALSRSYSVLIEGILHSAVYAEMLGRLRNEHAGPSCFFYLDVPLEETLRRHQSRPEATAFSESDMRGWYHPADALGLPNEHLLAANNSIDASVSAILTATGWSSR